MQRKGVTRQSSRATNPRYVCAGERIKLIGTINGFFPDMGHHSAKEMNGLWLHPIKLLDGFWMRLRDCDSGGEADCWMNADSFTNEPGGNIFFYDSGLSHTPVTAERFQFAPDTLGGLVIRYRFRNRGGTPRRLTTEFLARTDLRPVWLGETIGITDGERDEIEYREGDGFFAAKDCAHEWHVLFGSSRKPDRVRSGQFFACEITSGNGVSGSMEFDFTLAPEQEEEIVFFVAGSDQSRNEAEEVYRALRDYAKLLDEKRARLDRLTAQSDLTTEDDFFDEVFRWCKVNADWLTLDVPGIGRGLAAGLPEYPWWFGCDSCYAVQGLLAVGAFELAEQTLLILLNASEKANGDGRIVHEAVTNGVVPNHGNTQETAHFVCAVWDCYQWAGNLSFLQKCMPYIHKSMAWLEAADDDGDLFPSGYGIIEIAGMDMEMIDSAVYTCAAQKAYAGMCRLAGETGKAERAEQRYTAVRQAIHRRYWLPEERLFADTHTSAAAVESSLERIIGHSGDSDGTIRAYINRQIENNKDIPGESGWMLNGAWVIATPMEAGIAEPDYAEQALAAMASDRFIGEYGAYLSGLAHGATMTISTGAYAVAMARYGHPDVSLDLLRRMFGTFGRATPGSIAEMSPDYGCLAQGWTIYGPGVTVMNCFFGVQPDASAGEITVSPDMPFAWSRAILRNIRVLDGTIDISFERANGRELYRVANHTSFPVRACGNKPNVVIEILNSWRSE